MNKDELPLISCIMPTANRRDFLKRSIELFEAQDYPRKELIVVESGTDCNADIVKSSAYLYVPVHLAHIGTKRNIACHMSSGEIICHWDDDDYYGKHRLSVQLEPLLEDTADVTALKMTLLYNQSTGTLWHCSTQEHQRLFAHDCRAGTLMYRTKYFNAGLRYPDVSRGEDVYFLDNLLLQGARLEKIASPENYICVRHAQNITDDMDYASNPNWKKIATGELTTLAGEIQEEKE